MMALSTTRTSRESAHRLSDCVTTLLRDQPFFGSLALRLPIRADASRETLASNGHERLAGSAGRHREGGGRSGRRLQGGSPDPLAHGLRQDRCDVCLPCHSPGKNRPNGSKISDSLPPGSIGGSHSLGYRKGPPETLACFRRFCLCSQVSTRLRQASGRNRLTSPPSMPSAWAIPRIEEIAPDVS